MPKRILMTNDTGRKKPTAEGVYIQDIKGRYYTQDKWIGLANKPVTNGVALISSRAEFLISKEEPGSKLAFGSQGILVANIATTVNMSTAKMDLKGDYNTDQIMSQLGVGKCPAAEYYFNYTFPSGQKGYLPSFGEWYEAYANKAEIEECMQLIGGLAFAVANTSTGDNYYWSSTQYNAVSAWNIAWSTADGQNTWSTKNATSKMTRAFGKLI